MTRGWPAVLVAAVAVAAGGLFYGDTPVLRLGSAGCLLLVLGLLAWWPRLGVRGLLAVCAATAAVSLATSAWTWLAFGRSLDTDTGSRIVLWAPLESAALVVLIVLACRLAPARAAVAVAVVLGMTEALIGMRLVSPLGIGVVAFTVGVWSLPAIGGAALGAYLRSLDARRTRMIADARRTQRLDLARDLHDFVAHDVSGMVVQAQAGQVVAGTDPDEARDVFHRIEQAGLQALAAMDRTVHMLTDDAGASRHRLPGLDELADLVAGFGPPATLDLDAVDVPREVGTTAYRIVVEALTNVRRHAPNSTEVRVRVCREDDDLAVTVWNNTRGPVGERSSGLGIVGLTERAEALGGTLTAGPADTGWRLAARLPVAR
ncbi:sensor histidine kinase [Amycolatopsis suaedae]|uniref:histidine kinase n=1 Tax=Amycolatopsis suaedae TaxID=2510978 RepID=A0A4Q7JBF6_9PSEU|nr:histidine kinase [Amycolatopsis suaedae]RZQ64346.1 two-component sensor histidine kinase [Amycolatopsis suaedae]